MINLIRTSKEGYRKISAFGGNPKSLAGGNTLNISCCFDKDIKGWISESVIYLTFVVFFIKISNKY